MNLIVKLTCGVPQGSIVGPNSFIFDLLPLKNIIRKRSIDFHIYADDTQLYVTMSPDDLDPIDKLLECITDNNDWMAANFLKLNKDKKRN